MGIFFRCVRARANLRANDAKIVGSRDAHTLKIIISMLNAILRNQLNAPFFTLNFSVCPPKKSLKCAVNAPTQLTVQRVLKIKPFTCT